MPKTDKPSAQNRDDNIDDQGRDLRTGKARDEQHPQQTLEIGRQKPQHRPDER